MSINVKEQKQLALFTGFVFADLQRFSNEARIVFAIDMLRHLQPELLAVQKQKEAVAKKKKKVKVKV